MDAELTIEKERRKTRRSSDALKILLIDDDKDFIDTLTAVVKSLMVGCTVLTARSGLEGIELAKKEQPNVILLDVVMPEMDGFAACRRLVDDNSTSHIPIIIMTGMSDPTFYSRGLDAGASAFIGKPIGTKELVSQVRIALRVKGERDFLENKITITEAKYKALFDRASDGITLIDFTGKILEVNEAECKLEGYSREELLTMNLSDIDTTESSLLMFERMDKISKGESIIFDVEHVHKDGHLIPIEVSASLINVNGTQYIQAFHRDLTFRKESQKALIASEAQHKRLADNMYDMIVEVDVFGNRTYISPSHKRLFGETTKDLINTNYLSKVHPDDIQLAKDTFERAILTKSPQLVCCRQKITTGEYCWIESYGSPILNENQDVIGGVIVSRDITNKKKIEEALATSEVKYKEMFRTLKLMCDTNPDMLWAKNMNKEFIFANEEICKTLLNAKDTEEPIGKTDLFFANRERNLHPDDPTWHTFGELCQDSDQVIIDNQTIGHFEEIGNVKGKFLFLSVNKAPIIDNNKMIGIVGSGRDVTEHKSLEKKIEKSKLKYRAILDNLQDGFIQVDRNGVICFVSVSALEILGYNHYKDLYGTPIKDLFLDFDECKNIHQKLKNAGGSLYEQETEVVNKNGDCLTISFNAQIAYDKDGKITGSNVVFKDMTESKRRLSEIIKLYQVAEGSQNALMIIENDGTISYANNSVLKIIKASEDMSVHEHVLGRKVKSFISFDDGTSMSSVCELVEETGKWFGEAYIYCDCTDCGRIPIDIMFSKIIDDEDKTYIVASFHDTSERRELEQKIKDQSHMYEELAAEMYELTQGLNKIKNEKAENISRLEAEVDKSIADLSIITGEGDRTNDN